MTLYMAYRLAWGLPRLTEVLRNRIQAGRSVGDGTPDVEGVAKAAASPMWVQYWFSVLRLLQDHPVSMQIKSCAGQPWVSDAVIVIDSCYGEFAERRNRWS